MKKMFSSDNSLMIMSFVIAIIIWIYTSFVIDPLITVSVNDIPIQFVGHEQLEEKGLAVISESATTVAIEIEGSRKKMGSYDMHSIIAKADVSKADEGDVPVTITIPFGESKIIDQSVTEVQVKVEPIAEKTLDIGVNTVGTLAESYMSGDIKVNPEKVTLKGAASAVEKISGAIVKLNVSNADVDFDTQLPIIFLNEKGKELTELDGVLKRVLTDCSDVDVHCPVFKIKEVAPLAIFDDELPEGFSYKIEPSILYIYGEDVANLKLEKIETEHISLSKLTENDKVKAKLKIPANVKILYDISEVEVSVDK